MTARDADARLVRAARGGLAALSATFVALASHVAGGGQVPDLLGVVVPLVLSLPVCVAWAGRRLSLLSLSGSVVTSQFFFHVLFVLGAPSGSSVLTEAPGHAGHAGSVLPVPAAHAAGQAGHGAAHTDLTMWLWHAVAAAVTVVVLYRGERLLVRLCEVAGRAAAWLLHGAALAGRVVGLVEPARPGVLAAALRPLHPGPRLSSVRRRGPPALHAV